jgi:hypothetical protein
MMLNSGIIRSPFPLYGKVVMPVEEFSLPTTITALSAEIEGGRHVAHCLDFDLVETAASEDEAWARLVCTVKTYVEFGLSQGWNNCIRHRAPERYWNLLTPKVPVKFMPPLRIANFASPVIKAEVEPNYEALAAVG